MLYASEFCKRMRIVRTTTHWMIIVVESLRDGALVNVPETLHLLFFVLHPTFNFS